MGCLETGDARSLGIAVYTRPGYVNKKLLKMAIEIVSFPIEHGDFPEFFVNVYQRVNPILVSWSKHG